LVLLVSLSAGALMGGAFLHLLPESVRGISTSDAFVYVLVGVVVFFCVEKILHWRHCHIAKCREHTFAYMNLIGDCVHNFIDGLIIAASFLTDIKLGFVTTLAVVLHEIPQEIGDFGVLIYGGFNLRKALLLNFLVALVAVFGGLVGYFLSTYIGWVMFMLPIAAGGFIYISTSDLIPEIRKVAEFKKSIASLIIFLISILLMYSIKFIG